MFLVSLAIADLLVAIFVMPFAIVNDMQVSIYVFIIALPGFYCHSLIYHMKIFIHIFISSTHQAGFSNWPSSTSVPKRKTDFSQPELAATLCLLFIQKGLLLVHRHIFFFVLNTGAAVKKRPVFSTLYVLWQCFP